MSDSSSPLIFYKVLHEEFGVSYTNKFHIIESHLKYYLDTTKEGLGKNSDQVIESMHKHVNNLFQRSGYWTKSDISDIHGEKLLRGIHHVNSYNL